jgi:hypothetical protein
VCITDNIDRCRVVVWCPIRREAEGRTP